MSLPKVSLLSPFCSFEKEKKKRKKGKFLEAILISSSLFLELLLPFSVFFLFWKELKRIIIITFLTLKEEFFYPTELVLPPNHLSLSSSFFFFFFFFSGRTTRLRSRMLLRFQERARFGGHNFINFSLFCYLTFFLCGIFFLSFFFLLFFSFFLFFR